MTWILTIAQRRITSIAVAGRPDLTWTYQYDNDGNLMTVLAPGSATWRTYEYVANRMTASRDALGNLIESHTYDAYGWAVDSTGDADEIASIQYDLPGSTPEERVTRVTFRTGAIADYALRPSGGSLRVVRVTGGCASCGSGEGTFVRDDEGRVIREQHADGFITTRTYVADTLATEQRYLRPSGCDPQIDVNQCRIDPDALAAATLVATPATITTAYEHSDPLWPDKVTAVQTPSVLSANGVRREEIALHPIIGAATSTSSSGWTGTTPAQETRVTANQWYGDVPPCDAQGNGCTPSDALVPAFDPGGSFQTAWLSLSQPAGLARSTDGPRTTVADVTSYVHYPIDASVPSLLRGRLAAVKNAAGHIVHYESYDLFGNVTRIVDANGVATELTYDSLGRTATSTIKGIAGCDTNLDALCATDLTTTRTYSPPAGPLLSEQQPGGGVTVYGYDPRGRILTVSRGPSANDPRERIETSYDPLTGKKSLERRLALVDGAWVEKSRQSFAYDTEARLQTTTYADGAATHYAYDAADRIATVRDENHASPNTVYAYDPAGRLASVTQTLATAPGGTIVTSYAYDVQGNLISVTDPNTNATTYVVDDFGQMLSQESPVTGTATYGYGLGGELLTITDANGAMTTRVYDALGRPLSATSSRAMTPTETVQWQYDDATAGRFGVGRLTQMTDPTGVTTYFYERRGILRREERAFAGLTENYVTTFGHDANGNRSSVGYPSGTNVAYTVDFAGRQVAASASGPGGAATLVSSATYLPFGPATSVVFGNGTTQTTTYDNRYRMMQNKIAATSTIAQYDYGYDPAGNITSIADALDAGYDRTFAYDDLNRLVTADTGANLWRTGSYSYDAMGNMLSLRLGEVIRPPEPGDQSRLRPRSDVTTLPLGRVTTFAYSGTTPKLATVTNNDLERPVTYDAAGNEISYAIQRTYSARNLLSSVIEPLEGMTHRIDYGYDGRGLRVRRSEPPAAGGNSTRYFIYSPELQLLAVTNDDTPNPWLRGPRVNAVSPSIRTEILWFGGRPIAQVTGGTTFAYTFTDHLGTPTLQTSSGPTPTVIWRAEHEPFGNVYEMRVGGRTDQPLRFPGQEMAMTLEGQEENYNVFRWYRAGWGRYTQADPIGMEGGPNLYTYAVGNPMRYFDPLGLYRLRIRGTGTPVGLRDLDRLCRDTRGNVSGGACTPFFRASATCPCHCSDSGSGYEMDLTVYIGFTSYYFDGNWQQLLSSRIPHRSVHDSDSALLHEMDYHLFPAERRLRDVVEPYERIYSTEQECESACSTIRGFVFNKYREFMRASQSVEEQGGDPSLW